MNWLNDDWDRYYFINACGRSGYGGYWRINHYSNLCDSKGWSHNLTQNHSARTIFQSQPSFVERLVAPRWWRPWLPIQETTGRSTAQLEVSLVSDLFCSFEPFPGQSASAPPWAGHRQGRSHHGHRRQHEPPTHHYSILSVATHNVCAYPLT